MRTRAGRRFLPAAELQLSPVLRALAGRLPGAAGGIIAVAELVGPAGLPDLVAMPSTAALHERLALGVPALLAEGDARLVAACSAIRPLSLGAIARRAALSESGVERRLRRLASVGAVLPMSRGWVRASTLRPAGRLYALEAKVSDWQGGIAQALRYGGWADGSGAVLGRLPRNQGPAIEQAHRLGVGLALQDRWLVRPRVHQLPVARRLWASEHLVAALRGEQLAGDDRSDQSPSATA